MDILRIYNETIYDKYKSIEGVEDISSPLLVSSKRYIENVKDKPVMYIGQETNGWVNENGFIIHELDEIEKSYDYFLLERHTSGSIYWQFIKPRAGSRHAHPLRRPESGGRGQRSMERRFEHPVHRARRSHRLRKKLHDQRDPQRLRDQGLYHPQFRAVPRPRRSALHEHAARQGSSVSRSSVAVPQNKRPVHEARSSIHQNQPGRHPPMSPGRT